MSIIQGPLSIAPCQTPISRFAIFVRRRAFSARAGLAVTLITPTPSFTIFLLLSLTATPPPPPPPPPPPRGSSRAGPAPPASSPNATYKRSDSVSAEGGRWKLGGRWRGDTATQQVANHRNVRFGLPNAERNQNWPLKEKKRITKLSRRACSPHLRGRVARLRHLHPHGVGDGRRQRHRRRCRRVVVALVRSEQPLHRPRVTGRPRRLQARGERLFKEHSK